jgi:hypothetical protein
MRKLALILFTLIPFSGICQAPPEFHHGKTDDPFAFSIGASPGFTKITPFPSIFSYDLGANFGYFFKENIWLSAGVNYSHKGFKQNPFDIKLKTNPSNVTTTIDYFEFPILLHYRSGSFSTVTHEQKKSKKHTGKFGFTGSAGITPALLYDGKYSFPTATNDHQVDPSDLKKAGYKSIISVQASVGIYYHVSHSAFLTVEPEFKYSLSPVPQSTNYHWSTIGFKVSLWYRILPEFGV